MSEHQLMIYGAYGYTGELMTKEALKKGIKPILAGRSSSKLKPLTTELNLEFRAFDISEAEKFLQGINVLLNCAGPFSATAEPLVKSCIKSKVHYLDITGEIEVFQKCYELNNEAQKQNVIVMPGVGFDIVPTDCLAAMLKEKLPQANSIELAFSFGTKPSIGTAKTAIESAGKGGVIRENNQLKVVRNAYRIRKIPFQNGTKWATSIPWGDVFTSGISTNVLNGLVYTELPKFIIYILRITNPIKGLFNTKIGQRFLNFVIKTALRKTPTEEERSKQRTQFWGEAITSNGQKIAMTISAPNVYLLTAEAGIKIAEHCLQHNEKGGYYTPSMLLGSDFIKTISNVEVRTL